jgi:hypothetical protein
MPRRITDAAFDETADVRVSSHLGARTKQLLREKRLAHLQSRAHFQTELAVRALACQHRHKLTERVESYLKGFSRADCRANAATAAQRLRNDFCDDVAFSHRLLPSHV